uniref:F-box domain-containing protein n=1 Tax=Elaeophora elaphi TaxID=1147741 RepID=A0A0R3RV96_9BILA
MMAAAEKEEIQQNNDKWLVTLLNNGVEPIKLANVAVSMDEWDIVKQVYFNELIMRKVVSFVSDVRDRQNLELASIIMNDLSSRVPYISYNNDNSILDLYFTRVEPVMNIDVAGNEFKVAALTSSVRRACMDIPICQPKVCILKMHHIIKRFSRQIRRLRIGGISDFERRLGYIPDHQLVLSRDLCDEFDQLKNVESLVLRNLCLMSSVIEYWSGSKCVLTNGISSLCFHSIWFDHAEDIDNFVTGTGGMLELELKSIISKSVKKLYLSDCSGKTIMNIGRRLRALTTKLDILYIAIDHRTFRTVDQARQLFKEMSELACKLHICACFSRFICQPGFRILVNVISLFPEFQQITVMELDLGPSRKSIQIYQQFFTGVSKMSQLRVLRLFGFPISYGCIDFWRMMLRSIVQLSQITEFSVVNLLRNIRTDELDAFCKSLPPNLSTLALHHVHHLEDNHFSLIAQRCPGLDTLCVRDLRIVTSEGIMKALMEFRMLNKIAVCHSGPATRQAYELLANREAMPYIEAVILGGNRDHQNNSELSLLKIFMGGTPVLEVLLQRLPQMRIVGTWDRWRECEYHLWCSSKAYKELLDASCYADCPGCGKDVSLIDDDTDI